MATAFALARLRTSNLSDLVPDPILTQLLRRFNIQWRNRLLTPLVTLRLFLLQILYANTSMAHLRQLSGTNFSTSSYCAARAKLSLVLLHCLLQWTVEQARTIGNTLAIGPRVIALDCTTLSMSDTKVLRDHFGLPKGKGIKVGVAYPILKLATLIDLASGCVIKVILTALYVHEASGVLRLSSFIRAGDIVLGDRAFCTYVHFCLLNARGAFGCFRMHQKRKLKGTRIERWTRPGIVPKWIDKLIFMALPKFIDVRVVSYTITQAGFRTHQVTIATTLMDQTIWPDARIAELYGHRWEIETCFNHLKTTMKMCVLKCKTVDGVCREIMMYLIAYNLIRLTMLRYAMSRGISVRRVSLIDTMRFLAMRLMGLEGAPTN